MTDTVDSDTRSRIMSSVPSKNTQIELAVRKALFAKGFRYKVNDKTLPGTPDIVLPKYHAVIFVHGCFWHGHNCPKGRLPKSNIEYWQKKIAKNQNRDAANIENLNHMNWKVAIVWECSLTGKQFLGIDNVFDTLELWLKTEKKNITI